MPETAERMESSSPHPPESSEATTTDDAQPSAKERWLDSGQTVLLHAHVLSRPGTRARSFYGSPAQREVLKASVRPACAGATRVRVELHSTPAKDRSFMLVTHYAGSEHDAPLINAFRFDIEDASTEFVAEFYAAYLKDLAPGQTFVEEDFSVYQPGEEESIPQPTLKSETSIEFIRPYFKYPIMEASKRLGICSTSLKKICRANGLQRWPYRKVKSMETKMALVHCGSGPSLPTSLPLSLPGSLPGSHQGTDAAESSARAESGLGARLGSLSDPLPSTSSWVGRRVAREPDLGAQGVDGPETPMKGGSRGGSGGGGMFRGLDLGGGAGPAGPSGLRKRGLGCLRYSSGPELPAPCSDGGGAGAGAAADGGEDVMAAPLPLLQEGSTSRWAGPSSSHRRRADRGLGVDGDGDAEMAVPLHEVDASCRPGRGARGTRFGSDGEASFGADGGDAAPMPQMLPEETAGAAYLGRPPTGRRGRGGRGCGSDGGNAAGVPLWLGEGGAIGMGPSGSGAGAGFGPEGGDAMALDPAVLAELLAPINVHEQPQQQEEQEQALGAKQLAELLRLAPINMQGQPQQQQHRHHSWSMVAPLQLQPSLPLQAGALPVFPLC